MDSKLLEAAFNALGRWPVVQYAFAALIIAIAIVMLLKGLREKSSPAPPPPVPIQIESPWLVIEVERINTQCQAIERGVTAIHGRLDTLLQSLSDRGGDG